MKKVDFTSLIKMKKFFLIIVVLLLTISILNIYKNNQKVPDVTIAGYINVRDGIGRQSAELIDALRKDFTISFVPTRLSRFREINREVKKIAKKKFKHLGKVVIYEDYFEDPDIPKSIFTTLSKDQIRIAYSMIEFSKLPQTWVDQLNTYFDAIAVPDPFLIKIYQESGVNLPIFVIPLGLDFESFFHAPLKKEAHSPFVFANFSSCLDRKNQIALVRAFAKAFGNNPDAFLWINSRDGNLVDEYALLHEIFRQRLNNVHFSKDCVRRKDYLKRFQRIDCYVSLSKGEGFSIQPREAMALGIPVIVTDNTGQHTICESGLVASVPSTKEELAWIKTFNQTAGSCWNCNIDEAAALMKEMYDQYDKYLAKAESSRQWASQYRFTNLKETYKRLVSPKKVLLGDHNECTSEYLMTNSQDLFEKYQNLISQKKL